MQIQISFEKYEPVDLCLLFSVIYLFILLIWSKPWTKLYKTSVKKKYIPPNLYKIIINRYIEVLQIKMVIINNVN